MPAMNDGTIRSGSEDRRAHDVLAAEEFALPARDPSIGHPPVVLPEDPSGIAGPHDVLAAEEFALPASPPHAVRAVVASAGAWRQSGRLVAAGVGLVVVGGILRRRRR
jgi:hypothetical protein